MYSETVSTAKNNTIAIVLNGTERCGFFPSSSPIRLLRRRLLLLLPLSSSILRQHAFGFCHNLSTPVTTVNRKTDCNYLQQWRVTILYSQIYYFDMISYDVYVNII